MKIGLRFWLALSLCLLSVTARAESPTGGDPALPMLRAGLGMSVAKVRAGSTLQLGDIHAAIVPLAPVQFTYVEAGHELPIGVFCGDRYVRHCQDSAIVVTLGGAQATVDTIQVIYAGLTSHEALVLADRWRGFFTGLNYTPDPAYRYAFECDPAIGTPSCNRAKALPPANTPEEAERALLAAQPELRQPDAYDVFLGRAATGAEAAIRISTFRADSEQSEYSRSAAAFEAVYSVTLFVSNIR
jgi:hypothetical protein